MFVIGLAGGSGSGKSTLIEIIQKELAPEIISHLPMDAYYKDHGHLTPKQKKTHNFDHPDALDFVLLNNHIRQLRLGIPVDRPNYSFLTSSRLETTEKVFPSKILIIDGIFALCEPTIAQQMDLRIYLSVSETNRLDRTIKRDTDERGRTRENVEKRFYDMVKPMHDLFVEPSKQYANHIIDGNPNDIEIIFNDFCKIIESSFEHLHVS